MKNLNLIGQYTEKTDPPILLSCPKSLYFMHFILLQILSLTWRLGDDFCIAYRYFYYCFLFFLPLTLVFLAWHLFVENCKWNFAGEEGAVPR